MRDWFRILLAVVAALALAGLACSVGGGRVPTPPASPVVVSTESVGALEQTVQDALKNAQNGEVTIVVTEQQITSYAALKLAEEPDAPIQDVQVYLRDGQIQIYGRATVRGITAPAVVKMKVGTTAEGKLDVTVADAKFGPMPVPSSLLNSLSGGINEMLSGQFGPQATGIKITSVAIGDGQMSITGQMTR